jgi:hypothetical protein
MGWSDIEEKLMGAIKVAEVITRYVHGALRGIKDAHEELGESETPPTEEEIKKVGDEL